MTKKADDVETLFRYFTEIAITAQLSGRLFEKVMPDGMTMAQFGILNHLSRVGNGQTPVEIARAMQVTKGTMTSTLGTLERAGFIETRPDARDGRSKRIEISSAGREAVRAAIAAVEPEVAFLARQVNIDDVDASLPIVEKLRKLLDERRN
ncbi:MarR family transcriptional regulator [Rhizobium sp. KVB221]|uniref:MarR family transcriptional regulator n=1 Tax=Rhizobium setariae TaxID=2801340 RepID=A0A936YUX5_9HYPH|nr:MarR family transcriptional regulator [Rhizobium setariae]MBL0373170.1 MarR family transcriptional regulator [Rhizobium setariae]